MMISMEQRAGNNVSSLLLDYIQHNFVHDGGPPMKELNIIMDNCVGQNKNRMVIQMAAWQHTLWNQE